MVELPVDIKLRLDFKQFPLKMQKRSFPRISNKQNTSELCVDFFKYEEVLQTYQLSQFYRVNNNLTTCLTVSRRYKYFSPFHKFCYYIMLFFIPSCSGEV